MFSLMIDDGV